MIHWPDLVRTAKGLKYVWQIVAFMVAYSLLAIWKEYSSLGAVGDVSSDVSALFSLATLIPWASVSVRRLHDTNRSGWWLLIWFLPVVGLIILAFLLVQEGETPHTMQSASK